MNGEFKFYLWLLEDIYCHDLKCNVCIVYRKFELVGCSQMDYVIQKRMVKAPLIIAYQIVFAGTWTHT